VVTGSKPKQCR